MNAPFAAKQFFVVIAQSAAFDLTLSHAAFRLLAVIQALKDGETGITTASLHYLADQMGYNGSNRTRSVSDLLSVLIEKGYLIRVSGGIGRQSSSYFHKLDAIRPDRNPRLESGAISPPQTGGTGPSKRKTSAETGGAATSQSEGNATCHTGGSAPSSLIRLNLDASNLPILPAPPSPVTVQPVEHAWDMDAVMRRMAQAEARRPQPASATPAPEALPTVRQRQPKEPRAARPSDEPSPDFLDFWRAFDGNKACGRKEAWRVWCKVTRDADISAVATALLADAAAWKDRPTAKRPHATTWLNRERWKDDPSDADAASQRDRDANSSSLSSIFAARSALRASTTLHGAPLSGPPSVINKVMETVR